MNSSSIVDVFRSFSSAVDFLYSLEWPDLYQEAQFLTALAKVRERSSARFILQASFLTGGPLASPLRRSANSSNSTATPSRKSSSPKCSPGQSSILRSRRRTPGSSKPGWPSKGRRPSSPSTLSPLCVLHFGFEPSLTTILTLLYP